MNIPKECDICGSKIIEGDYGDSWWLCTNKKCKKNNPNWNFNQKFEPYREKYNELDNKINELSKVNVDNYEIEIELHEARWISEGSGEINIKNNDFKTQITFYFDKDKVIYITDNITLLGLLNEINLDLRLKEIWSLIKERNSILGFKRNKIN